MRKLNPMYPSLATYRFKKDEFVIEVVYAGPGNDIHVVLLKEGRLLFDDPK